jgi:hypothetical protein
MTAAAALLGRFRKEAVNPLIQTDYPTRQERPTFCHEGKG